jgi:hypothetical protein
VIKGFEDLLDRYHEVLTGAQMVRAGGEVRRTIHTDVRTVYKRKDQKILPVNTPLVDGASPGEYPRKGLSAKGEMHLTRMLEKRCSRGAG